MEANPSFLQRNEFFIRRLHSLSGLIPVGAYMCVHLLTNATVLDSPAAFQDKVYTIHSLGAVLPLIEWTFIFAPILFHAILGVVIIRSGTPNHGAYNYGNNYRYTAQRVTGMIAFFFIMWHVFHMHGWFHFQGWIDGVAAPLGGAQFKAYNAASTASAALTGWIVPTLYAIGILSCVFHLANGIWTMGITWGVWISPAAQKRANWLCGAFGVGLACVGMGALIGMTQVNIDDAATVEDQMYEARLAAGSVKANDHKRSSHGEGEHAEQHGEEAAEDDVQPVSFESE